MDPGVKLITPSFLIVTNQIQCSEAVFQCSSFRAKVFVLWRMNT